MSRKNIIPLDSYDESLTVQWLTDKFCNFTKNKTYKAKPQSKGIGKNAPYHDFRITDDEGDAYSLNKRDINKKYQVTQGTIL